MGKTATLNLRVNPDVKENAENVVLLGTENFLFEARYDTIVRTTAKEYEDTPPSDYYRDGYNLYLRMTEYKHHTF